MWLCSSGATSACAWRTEPVRRAWTGAGVCGRLGGNAAGPAGAESLLPSDAVTVPGTAFSQYMSSLSRSHDSSRPVSDVLAGFGSSCWLYSDDLSPPH